jgi:hypothetical protein
MKVPERWAPHLPLGGRFWFWAPADWQITTPLSGGSCYALARNAVLLEAFLLRAPSDNLNPATFFGGIAKQGHLERFPGARVLRDAPYALQPFDVEDALRRLLMERPREECIEAAGKVPPANGYRCTFESKEGPRQRMVTDCYSLHRGDSVLQLNIKTFLDSFGPLHSEFEQIVTTVMMVDSGR